MQKDDTVTDLNEQLYEIKIANEEDRKCIYKLRYKIYAEELHQHKPNPFLQLEDKLDQHNIYIIAKRKEIILGFISITPPRAPTFSIDKYFNRSNVPLNFDKTLYEVRLLTVQKIFRYHTLAFILMYAACRWVSSHGGKNIVAICRTDLINFYIKLGLRPINMFAKSGELNYQLSSASVNELENIINEKTNLLKEIKSKIVWNLPFSFFKPSTCYHGGSFFEAIGEDLQTIDKNKIIINADVLDAWFPPSPKVVEAIKCQLPWLLQTSPPTHSTGLIKAISKHRYVDENCILPGAGSSDLIFLAMRHWLNPKSKVLILDPCYGEYFHVLEKIIHCQVHRHNLKRKEGFVVNTNSLLKEIKTGYDMIIIVNPNSPTGVHIPKKKLENMLLEIPNSTMVWVDETYIEYAGSSQSLEFFASQSENIIVCKSMSKVYALSGARVAYLCSSPHLIEQLKPLTPPWAVSLPSQLAAITALKDEEYYKEKYTMTHMLRENLKQSLLEVGIKEIIPGIANFILFYLPEALDPKDFVESCKSLHLYIRDVSGMGKTLGNGAIRIAVKDEHMNIKMVEIMSSCLEMVL